MGPSECLSAEALTLIIEGKAGWWKRKAWMSHLDECTDCRTVLAQAGAYVEERRERDAREGSGSRVVERAGWRHPWILVPVFGALAVVGVVVGASVMVSFSDWLGHGGPASVELVEPLISHGATKFADRLWRDDSSGASFAMALAVDQIAFRIGIYLIDLRIALREEQVEAASNALHELEALIRVADHPGESLTFVTGIRDSVRSGDFLGAREGLDRLAGTFEQNDDPFFVRFGEWAEASRLAASAGWPGFFRSRVFGDPLEEFRSRGLPAAVSSRLREIEQRTAGDGEIDLSSVERELRSLILLY
jgi:hypothetical protein